MRVHRRTLLTGAGLALLPLTGARLLAEPLNVFDIRAHGAKGDGKSLDTAAIQHAIDAAAAAGGGTVYLPPGRYLSFTLRLRSRITLLFASGAVLVAADPAKHHGHYDLPEPNPNDIYQDFGHSHWRNSLIWGENLQDVAILGPGLIDGAGLTRISPSAPWSLGIGRGAPMTAALEKTIATYNTSVKAMNGLGNKAIALKNSRGVTLRDFSILRGGHFGILLTGVDNVVMDGLTIDTNRDGMDLDVVRNARLTNLSVNSPYDDAIVLKSSLALGVARPTENIAIANCNVSGYDVGTLLDGTYKRSQLIPPLKHRTSGRIKLGTESNGGYRNIAISNCVFDCCNGLALESVDGAALEDVTVSNLVMRDVTAAPLFIRLADRRRAPKGTPIASLSRVSISNIDAACVDPRYCATITGVPGAMARNITLRGMRFVYPGGGTAAQARRKMPEMVDSYPDPDIFGVTSAWGLYMRHVRGIVLDDIELTALTGDARPAVAMEDVKGLIARELLAAAGHGQMLKPVAL